VFALAVQQTYTKDTLRMSVYVTYNRERKRDAYVTTGETSAVASQMRIVAPFSTCPSVLPGEITKADKVNVRAAPRGEPSPRISFIASANYAHRSPGRERGGK
jgi:hypothetical protein